MGCMCGRAACWDHECERPDVWDRIESRVAARQRPKNTVRVWASDWPESPLVVCVAVWGKKPNGYYGITHAYEIRTAGEWNVVLDRLEEVL